MTARPAEPLEMLRAKAMLLLRREREVYELRHERSRIEVWLRALHDLSLDLQATTPQPLLEKWVRVMVSELNFGVAGVYAFDAASGLRLQSGLGRKPLPQDARLDAEACAYLAETSYGSFEDGLPELLRPLATEVDLGGFLWFLLTSHGHRLLLIAGYATGNEFFHAGSPFDLTQFALVGRHLTALLHNVELLAELDREKSELSASNAQLDISVKKLEEAQSQIIQSGQVLAEVSRRAGMADMATGVLHNVGNALNSVNVSADLAATRVRQLRVDALPKLAELLGDDAAGGNSAAAGTDRERAQDYLRKLAIHLKNEKQQIIDELDALSNHIDHIKSVVSRQQRYAVTLDMSETVKPAQLMEEALGISRLALGAEQIDIVRDFRDVPEVTTDRHKVLQILVNLISNAKHALVPQQVEPRRITLGVEPHADRQVRFTVEDTGIGIPREDLPKIFRYGFTTREHGHGFGLHASALFASELGGTIQGESQGPGRGARFTLALPVKRAPRDGSAISSP